MVRLGVNIDHVATLRQARRTDYPDVLAAAFEALAGGADFITVHLREDRRHIQDADLRALRERLPVRLNLELAVSEEMLAIACALRPSDGCLVPERRAELTTEGGLAWRGREATLAAAVARLTEAAVHVSLFLDPDEEAMDAAARIGAPAVELHTGAYAHATGAARDAELGRLEAAARRAGALGIQVNAGHGLTVANVGPIARLPHLAELNIGHAIVARAVFVGLRAAVAEMKTAIGAA
jgi:pyridoxine 5-phosphate synthase